MVEHKLGFHLVGGPRQHDIIIVQRENGCMWQVLLATGDIDSRE
jgi:hypothetical protein